MEDQIKKWEKQVNHLEIAVFCFGCFVMAGAAASNGLLNLFSNASFMMDFLVVPPWMRAVMGLMLFGTVFGIRKRNSAAGFTACVIGFLLLLTSALAPFPIFLLEMSFPVFTGYLVLIVCFYLVPFLIICVKTAALVRLNGVRKREEELMEQNTARPSGISGNKTRNAVFLIIGSVMTVIGLTSGINSAVRSLQPVDIGRWERYSIKDTGISLLMPMEPIEYPKEGKDGEDDGTFAMMAEAKNFFVMVARFSEEPEEETWDMERPKVIWGPETGTMNGVEYEQEVSRYKVGRLSSYSINRHFTVNGIRYTASVNMLGRMQWSLMKKAENIFDSIKIN